MAREIVKNLGEDVGQVAVAANSSTFQMPDLIAAPYTTITDLSGNARKLPDPSKTIRPVFGVERIPTKSIKLVADEKGSNGESVFRIDGDERVRFVGSTWQALHGINGGSISVGAGASNTDHYIEITFYGTGINFLNQAHSGALDWRYSIDGGAESANWMTSSGNIILGGRNYSPNHVYSLVQNLTLGLHTIKIRKADAISGFITYGFEIIGPSASISIPEGKAIVNGESVTLPDLVTTSYNSGFTIGTDNGRGGRVVIYKNANGVVQKALQPAGATPAYLGSADHSIEEVVRKVNFREFGANRADDFSTLSGSGTARAFTLDDGTHTLIGSSGVSVGGTPEGVAFGAGHFITKTFVGTGLDIELSSDGSSRTYDAVSIDGAASVGTINKPANSGVSIVKIVSGLPYGTHTVRLSTTGSTSPLLMNFITYGPKKPTIPEGAVELGEYYLMANFSANTASGLTTIATGTLRKYCTREFVYFGGSWAGPFVVEPGQIIQGNTNGHYFEYVFFGTGFEYRANWGNGNAQWQMTLFNNANPGGTNNFSSYTTSAYTYIGWTPATGTMVAHGAISDDGAGVRVSGLPLGIHRIRFTRISGTSGVNHSSLDIITPIHYPNTKAGSLALKPAIEVKQQVEENNVDLSKAKAWLVFNGANQTILSSYNIAALLRLAIGQYTVYFEKPFKNEHYVATYNGSHGDMFLSVSGTPSVGDSSHKRASSITFSTATVPGIVGDTSYGMLVFFGELADEEIE